MGFQPGLDVFGFGTGPDDTEADFLVVFELQFQDGFDDGLSHGQTVLGLALLNNAQTRCSIVVRQESVKSERDLH